MSRSRGQRRVSLDNPTQPGDVFRRAVELGHGWTSNCTCTWTLHALALVSHLHLHLLAPKPTLILLPGLRALTGLAVEVPWVLKC